MKISSSQMKMALTLVPSTGVSASACREKLAVSKA